MYVYYKNTEYTPGKQRIVDVVYDRDYFAHQDNTNDCSILVIDEIAPDNKIICIDLVNTISKMDAKGDNKYYVSGGVLYEKDGWVEKPQEAYEWQIKQLNL